MMLVSASSFAEQISKMSASKIQNFLLSSPSDDLEVFLRKSNLMSPKTSEDLNFLLKYTLANKIMLSPFEAVVGSNIYTEDQGLALLRDRYPNKESDQLRELRNIAISKVSKIVNTDEYLVGWLTNRTALKAKKVGSFINIIKSSDLSALLQQKKKQANEKKNENLKKFEKQYLPVHVDAESDYNDEGQAM